MKKVAGEYCRHFYSIVLYREDVDEILGIIEECAGAVRIRDDEFSYDSLDELIEKRGKRLKRLSLMGVGDTPGYLSLEVNADSPPLGPVRLSGRGNENVEAGFLRIERLLLRRRLPVGRFLPPELAACSYLGVGGLIGTSTVAMIVTIPDALKTFLMTIIILLAALGLIGFAAISQSMFWFYDPIILEKKHKADSFWKRNRDKIIWTIVTGAISLIAWLVGKYFSG